MPRKPRTPCREKVPYSSFVQAMDALVERLANPYSHITYAYKCSECFRWHMTSQPLTRAERNPFPSLTGRWVVTVSGQKVWNTTTEHEAFVYAQRIRGALVEPEYVPGRRPRNYPNKKHEGRMHHADY